MSKFTKRRLITRKRQEAERKQWEESLEKTNKSMKDILKTTQIIKEQYPEFGSLNGDERAKLFSKIYNEIHKDD